MTKKTFIYIILLAISIIGITAAFLTSKTFTQLAVATFLYPPLVYFALRYFPGNPQKVKIRVEVEKPPIEVQPVNKPEKEAISIADIDRRAFLKLLGGAGLTYFLFSIFNKRVEALFPGPSATGSGETVIRDSSGNQINPAENQPTDGYKISEVDSGEITYYGFINKNGAWYIMKEDPNTGSFRYARAESNFPGNWAGRDLLKYDYFYKVFP